MIALVMQHLDNSITTFTEPTKLGFRRMTSKQGHGEPNPTWIPVGNEVTRRIAKKIDGVVALAMACVAALDVPSPVVVDLEPSPEEERALYDWWGRLFVEESSSADFADDLGWR